MSRRKPTAAERVRARQDAAMAAPPGRVAPRAATVKTLTLIAEGREWNIAPAVGADTPWEMPIDGAATVTIPIRSDDGQLLKLLADEARVLQADGVTTDIDGIRYALAGVEGGDDGLITLTFEDHVAWRLRQFTRFISATRDTTTRAQFIRRMVMEASSPPRAPMKWFIPELNDIQPIAGGGAAGSGSGS